MNDRTDWRKPRTEVAAAAPAVAIYRTEGCGGLRARVLIEVSRRDRDFAIRGESGTRPVYRRRDLRGSSRGVPESENPVPALATGEGCRAAHCLPGLDHFNAAAKLVAKCLLVGQRPLLMGR